MDDNEYTIETDIFALDGPAAENRYNYAYGRLQLLDAIQYLNQQQSEAPGVHAVEILKTLAYLIGLTNLD